MSRLLKKKHNQMIYFLKSIIIKILNTIQRRGARVEPVIDFKACAENVKYFNIS